MSLQLFRLDQNNGMWPRMHLLCAGVMTSCKKKALVNTSFIFPLQVNLFLFIIYAYKCI